MSNPDKPLRVALVNDSRMALAALRHVIERSGRYRIAWMAEDGRQAVARCAESRPDILLMDLNMPVMDGVEATRHIMAQSPCAIVVVTASVEDNATRAFAAMGAGALDALNTPVLGMSGDAEGQDVLLAKLDTVARLVTANRRTETGPAPAPAGAGAPLRRSGERLIAIGASTGGPAALRTLLGALPADLPAAIVIVQHVDEEFAQSFANWLNSEIILPVRLARPGDFPKAGEVLVAGREDHLVLQRDQRLGYTREPVDYAYRPSVNAFFDSVAAHWGGRAIGVLLTGMGRDGASGLAALRRRGWTTIAQDRETSAIYGMPRAAAELDAASRILPLDKIAPALLEALEVTPMDKAGQETG